MQVQNQLSLHHSNRYSAESACAHCEGIIRHEFVVRHTERHYLLCISGSLTENQLSLGDELILHGLGVVWITVEVQVETMAPT